MPVVISDSLVIAAAQEFDDDNPIILWDNLTIAVSSHLISDDTEFEDADFPAENLLNPATNLQWKAGSSGVDVYLRVDFDGLNPIDAVAWAAHNLGSSRRALRVYGATGVDGNDDPVYFPVTHDFMLADDTAVLVRIEEANYISIKITMVDTQSGTPNTPTIGAIYGGKLLVSERKLQVAFTPLIYGRRTEVLSGRSEAGRFLGRVVTSAWLESAANISFMSPDWYREFMEPFIEAAQTEPFFFAWAPTSYPNEVGYAWLMADAVPSITHSVNFMAISLQMQGIA